MIVLQELLEKIGLTDKETRVYLAALEMGSQPASTFAKRAHLNRSTAYVILTSLINKGLMSSFVKDGITRYSAVQPRKLLRYIDNKREHFDECKKEIVDMLPAFESLSTPMQKRPKVKYFEGLDGIKVVMEDTLTSSEALRCYSSLQMWLDGPLAAYIRDYGRRRIFEAEVALRGLVYDDPVAREYLSKEYPSVHHEHRLIPKNLDIVSNEINIYDDKVAIVCLEPGDYFGVIIESPQIAETQKSIFEMAWQVAKKP